MGARPLSEARAQKAVLNVLERYDGVPLSVRDVAEEAGLPLYTAGNMLSRLWSRYSVQKRVQTGWNNTPVQVYWIGFPKL